MNVTALDFNTLDNATQMAKAAISNGGAKTSSAVPALTERVDIPGPSPTAAQTAQSQLAQFFPDRLSFGEFVQFLYYSAKSHGFSDHDLMQISEVFEKYRNKLVAVCGELDQIVSGKKRRHEWLDSENAIS